MSWKGKPVPNVTPETTDFWEAAAEERLLLSECSACGLIHYYPRSHCPDCFSPEVQWREAKGLGHVYSYTSTMRVGGWPEDELPLIIAYVELKEGPRILTNLVSCEPENVGIGDEVRVEFRDVPEADVGVPVFRHIG